METVTSPSPGRLFREGGALRGRIAIALNVVLGIVVAFETIFVGHQIYGRWDLTQDRSFTISERAKNFLQSLEDPVHITVFYSDQYPLHVWARQRIEDLLEEFQLHSDRLEVKYIDPYRSPAETQQIRQKLGIPENDFNDGVVVFRYGEKAQYVADNRIVEYAFNPQEKPIPDRIRDRKTFLGEDAFMTVMFNLVEGVKPVVYFLTGHGESSPDDREAFGLSMAAGVLQGDGYDVRQLLFSERNPIVPEDADLVIIASPRSPLPNEHIHVLKGYAEQGGKFLIFPSLQFREGETKPIDMNLGPLLDHFDVEVSEKVLIEDVYRGRQMPVQMIRVTKYDEKHPATKAMGKGEEKPTNFWAPRVIRPKGKQAVPVVFSSVTTIEKGDMTEVTDERRYQELVRRQQSLFNPEKDKRGPFPLVVVSEVPGKRPELTARAVVAGTHTAIANGTLMLPLFNKDLFLNLVNWQTARESHMGIAAKHPREVAYHVRPSTRKKVFVLVMVVLPLIAIVAGAGVWMLRRT
ncbi:MAG: GldG family protein [Planctomycetota bacterium]|jgi:hypothetical protein